MKANVKKIQIAMARAEMTSALLGEKTGLSRTSIGKILKGGSCKPYVFGRIAKALEVDVTELLDDETKKE